MESWPHRVVTSAYGSFFPTRPLSMQRTKMEGKSLAEVVIIEIILTILCRTPLHLATSHSSSKVSSSMCFIILVLTAAYSVCSVWVLLCDDWRPMNSMNLTMRRWAYSLVPVDHSLTAVFLTDDSTALECLQQHHRECTLTVEGGKSCLSLDWQWNWWGLCVYRAPTL